MQDDDYSAYLKRQSYDDLVSISDSIDKEASAERYQMALAEIAARDAGARSIDSGNTPALARLSEKPRGWFDRAFFVKEPRPRVAIVLCAAVIGLLINFALRIASARLRASFFGYTVDAIFRYALYFSIVFVLTLVFSGVYNFALWLNNRNNTKVE